VKPAKRCEYVTTLASCSKDDNLLHYLRIHYCSLGDYPVVSAFLEVGA
jgi:hypothetical protein